MAAVLPQIIILSSLNQVLEHYVLQGGDYNSLGVHDGYHIFLNRLLSQTNTTFSGIISMTEAISPQIILCPLIEDDHV